MRSNTMVLRRRLTALAVVACLTALAFLGSVRARALDLDRPVTLTPELSDKELRGESVVFDLYLIARIERSGDGFAYRMMPAYTALAADNIMDRAETEALAQSAARLALSSGVPIVSGARPGTRITHSDHGGTLTAGLYLLLARGEGTEEYAVYTTDADGADWIGTAAYTDEYRYLFAPELLCLPVADGAEGLVLPDASMQAVYDATVSVKAEREPRYGVLEIVKTLRTYDAAKPAVFVFDIEAVREGRNVYSDVASIIFSGSGKETLRIDDLPVGAVVTVTEVYSGAGYTLLSERAQTVTVGVDGAAVSFLNDCGEGSNSGGGAINHFTYDADAGWSWEAIQSGAAG